MQPIAVAVREEWNVRVGVRIKSGVGVDVDYLRGPDVPCFLDDVHLVVDEEPTFVRVRLVGLHVPRPKRRVAAVNRREENDVCGGKALNEM